MLFFIKQNTNQRCSMFYTKKTRETNEKHNILYSHENKFENFDHTR